MSLTLEMPSTPESLPGQTTFIPDAEAGLDAADLIDQGEQEAEAEVEQPAAVVESASDDPPLDTNNPTGATPDSVPAGSLETPPFVAKVDPPPEPIVTSHATRKFQIAQVTAEYTEVCLEIAATRGEVERHKSRLKVLEEEFERLSAELMHLRNDEQYQPRLPMGDATANGERPAAPTVAGAAEGEVPPAAASPKPSVAYAWQLEPLSAMELPAKLTEKLSEDGISTVGELNSRMLDIEKSRATWPKGIGAAKQEIITDTFKGWLSAWEAKNLIPGAAAGTQPAGTQDVRDIPAESKDAPPAVSSDQPTATEPITKPKRTRKKKEPSAAAAAAAPKPPGNASPHRDNGHAESSTAAADPTDAEWSAAITARAKLVNDGSAGCLDARLPKPAKQWDSGYEAYGRGMDLADCPYVAGAEQDDWLRGWMGARAVRDLPDAGEPSRPSAAAAALYGDDIDEI